MATATQSVNYWPKTKCAKAFWGQNELPPYQELLRDTKAWLAPRANESWLDLGCGGGTLTRALWELGHGQLAQVVGADCARVNAEAYQKLRERWQLAKDDPRLRFVPLDFSQGLGSFPDNTFNGVVSGLAIHYAESFAPATGQWTTAAYDRVLAEVYRVLKPGGRFVFSVMMPHPSWVWVMVTSLSGIFRTWRPWRFLKKTWRMYLYGGWLTREAKRGRFHYLPAETVIAKLEALGFTMRGQRTSYAGQAYLFHCQKPA